MTAYVVRLADDLEFVGIVSCDSPNDLSEMVDEFCNPSLCEYAKLPDGMIGAAGEAPIVPDKFVGDGDDSNFLACSEASEVWADALAGVSKLVWKPVI